MQRHLLLGMFSFSFCVKLCTSCIIESLRTRTRCVAHSAGTLCTPKHYSPIIPHIGLLQALCLNIIRYLPFPLQLTFDLVRIWLSASDLRTVHAVRNWSPNSANFFSKSYLSILLTWHIYNSANNYDKLRHNGTYILHELSEFWDSAWIRGNTLC